jgi:hypothetical protein
MLSVLCLSIPSLNFLWNVVCIKWQLSPSQRRTSQIPPISVCLRLCVCYRCTATARLIVTLLSVCFSGTSWNTLLLSIYGSPNWFLYLRSVNKTYLVCVLEDTTARTPMSATGHNRYLARRQSKSNSGTVLISIKLTASYSNVRSNNNNCVTSVRPRMPIVG